MKICLAPKRKSGEPCQAYAMTNGRCRIHGGKSLTGIAAPRFETGRYSKFLPTRLVEKYNTSKNDGELVALRDDLALLDARLEDLLAKVDTGETGEAWKALQEAVHAFKTAESKANYTANERKQAEYKADREMAMQTILLLVQSGMSDYAAWADIKSTLEQRRKTAETEFNRLVKMDAMVSAEKLLVMQSQFLEMIRRHVSDRPTLIALSNDFALLSAKTN